MPFIPYVYHHVKCVLVIKRCKKRHRNRGRLSLQEMQNLDDGICSMQRNWQFLDIPLCQQIGQEFSHELIGSQELVREHV